MSAGSKSLARVADDLGLRSASGQGRCHKAQPQLTKMEANSETDILGLTQVHRSKTPNEGGK